MRARHVVAVVLATPLFAALGFGIWLLMFSDAWQESLPSSPIFFPRHTLTGESGLPAGDIAGQLTLEDSCLWIEGASGERYLALWPSDLSLERGTRGNDIRTAMGRTVARIGEPIHAGGGAYSDVAFVEELIEAGVPSACRGAGYWLVSEVLE